MWDRACEKSTSVGGAQFFVLQRLSVSGLISINDLATLTLTDQSTVSVLVKRLAERGLVERKSSPKDARKVLVHITPAGRALVSKAPSSPLEKIVQAVLALPRSDSRKLAKLLERVMCEAGLQTRSPGLIIEERSQSPNRKKTAPKRK